MIGYPEMCATNLEIMRTDFTDYEQNVHTLFILILIFCPLDYLENCQISVAVGVWQRTPLSEQFSFMFQLQTSSRIVRCRYFGHELYGVIKNVYR